MSGVYCAVVKCTSSTNRNRDLQFYELPLENNARCRLWIKAAGRTDLLKVTPRALLQDYLICGLHFKPSDFIDGSMKLSAIPSRHLYVEKKPSKPRPVRRESVLNSTPTPNKTRLRGAVSKNASPSGDEATPGPSQVATRSSARKQQPNNKKTKKSPSKKGSKK